MSAVKLAEGEWVIVCDGAKALILENTGDKKFPNLKTLSVREQPDLSTRELGAERPGRVIQSHGSAHSSVEQTDWHDRAEEQFLHALVTDIATHIEQGKIRDLTMVAPPRALGMLRAHYTPALKNVLRHEIAHDYVKKPVREIEKLLTS